MDAVLDPFIDAGLLDPGDRAIAERWGELVGEPRPEVLLAAALCVRALRAGSVCVDIRHASRQDFRRGDEAVDTTGLPWPDPNSWLAALEDSPMVSPGPQAPAERPLRLVAGLVYLERYWGHQEAVRAHLERRMAVNEPCPPELVAAADALFTGAGLAPDEPDRQREAALRAQSRLLTVIAGGPGTGKTSTVARLLAAGIIAAQARDARPPRVALAAPTGKAAVRLEESLRGELAALEADFPSLQGLRASTLHRLLGWLPTSASRFQHDARNPLPYDLVIVDEASMVSLSLVRRLLDALRPSARLVLVGDPDQLTPVEAGAVLTDIVRSPAFADATVELTHNWRFGSEIAHLATAVRAGDADAVLAALVEPGSGAAVDFVAVDPMTAGSTDLAALRERVVRAGVATVAAARAGDGEGATRSLDSHRLLCAHRTGSYGVSRWAWESERWLAEGIPGFGGGEWYIGRPVLINANLRDVALYNGDAGVVIHTDDGPRAAFERATGPMLISPSQLSDVTTLFAMTVHKSQGSQFEHVTVVLPPPDSPLLTRELLYTAITRAQKRVTIIGTPESVRAAVERPVVRASGLRARD